MGNYVVFDLETTGISTSRDDIIEISAIRVNDHERTETFSRLVNPGRPIPPEATRINGITDEMVCREDGLGVILPEFLNFIGKERYTLYGEKLYS